MRMLNGGYRSCCTFAISNKGLYTLGQLIFVVFSLLFITSKSERWMNFSSDRSRQYWYIILKIRALFREKNVFKYSCLLIQSALLIMNYYARLLYTIHWNHLIPNSAFSPGFSVYIRIPLYNSITKMIKTSFVTYAYINFMLWKRKHTKIVPIIQLICIIYLRIRSLTRTVMYHSNLVL